MNYKPALDARNITDVLNDIKALVREQGFIYALCLIIMKDFHYGVEEMHEIDHRSRLNKNEVSLLLGYLIQCSISLDTPASPDSLIELRKRTYTLMEELHRCTMTPFFKKFESMSDNPDLALDKQDFFVGDDLFVEPIFYAGDGIYDFQYLEFLERKYKYDVDWLNTKANFYFDKAATITHQIKGLHQGKIAKLRFFGVDVDEDKILDAVKDDKTIPRERRKMEVDNFLSALEFYQFQELFEIQVHETSGLSHHEIAIRGWNSFYNGLLELFVVRKSDFAEGLDISAFMDKFSIEGNQQGQNTQFQNVGDFNLFASRPIVQIDSDRFFVPISYSVFEAVYESPFYWMLEDRSYKDRLAGNRGRAGEEIVYELLTPVFGKDRVFMSVRIESKKGQDDTDIDVLCVLGSKAVCVQVKSKKLTQLSRQGDIEQLKKDFKGAVQDAYQQGLICRDRILQRKATFYDASGLKINLSEEIDDVYILIVTTENYPSLTHQRSALMEKKDSDPHALTLTVFDLELVAYYLNNPYEFLYYVRQRIQLMDVFLADEEMCFLGYHLIHKLWKLPGSTLNSIGNDFSQLIDQNYYPLKLGIETSSKNDKIRNRWTNESFNLLCKQIAELNSPRTTDIIFHLLDWAENSRDNLVNQIIRSKFRTQVDDQEHNFSLTFGPTSRLGVTFVSRPDNDRAKLISRLLFICEYRKYKCKADLWIGIGCLRNSDRFVDATIFTEEAWQYDKQLEERVKVLSNENGQNAPVKFGRKTGRNDSCPCGSGLKYKKCCGR